MSPGEITRVPQFVYTPKIDYRLFPYHVESTPPRRQRHLTMCASRSPGGTANVGHGRATGNVRTLFGVDLSEDVVDHIVHLLNERPSHLSSLSCIEPKDVLTIFRASEQLRKAALRKWKCVESTRETERASFKRNGEETGLLVEDRTLLAPIMSSLGSTLRKLIVDTSITFSYDELMVAIEGVSENSFERTCVNVFTRQRTWVSVLTRAVRSISDLELRNVRADIPLRVILSSRDSLKWLHASCCAGCV